uniref:Uncharacterized protein n=1 Tax=Setaria viridis TaxID=4556 RepID=A0A4U6TH12_SETVI|nr:hypothetical protein SEVIR_8G191900v2 [Setaria viridis]
MKLCGSIVSISCDLFCYLTFLYRKRFGLVAELWIGLRWWAGLVLSLGHWFLRRRTAPPQRPEPEEHAPPRPLHLSLPCRWFAGTNVSHSLPPSPLPCIAAREVFDELPLPLSVLYARRGGGTGRMAQFSYWAGTVVQGRKEGADHVGFFFCLG